MNKKLPIFKVLKKAVSLVFIHFKKIIILSTPLVLAFFCILFFVKSSVFSGISSLILITIVLISTSMLTVGCHRVFLLGEKERRKVRPFRWVGTEFRFMGWTIVLSLINALFVVPIPLIFIKFLFSNHEYFELFHRFFILIALFFHIPGVLITSRFSMVLPASAIGLKTSLKKSWFLTKGNSFRLFSLLMIPTLVILLLF